MMARLPTLPRSDRQKLSATVAVVAVAYLVVVTATMGRVSYDAWAPLWLLPALLGGSFLLIGRSNPHAAGVSLVPLVRAALVAKALGTIARYAVTYGVYDGNADATNYHQVGSFLAQHYRRGDFNVDLGPGSTSTAFMKVVTGVVYTVIGPSKIGGFAVFATASFWGVYLCLRAFQMALPAGNVKRYALLVFFLPSMLFWSSSIGKEAWMTLALGLAAYGAARLFTHQRRALLPLALGLVAALVVRPHIAIVVVAGLFAGYVVRPHLRRGMVSGRVGKVVGVVCLAVVGVVATQQMQDALNLDSSSSVNEALDFAQARTDEGGSSFTAARINSPVDVPWATVTVLFRPFPHEADNLQMLVSSLEGVMLLALFVASLRRLIRAPRLALRHPYVAFVMLYSLIFVFAFSSFGNFGIITRQRVQLFPFVLALICLGSTQFRQATASRSPVLTRTEAATR